MTEPRTMVFFPESAYGPTNNCVGIGNVLRERGHRVVFVLEESFVGTLEQLGDFIAPTWQALIDGSRYGELGPEFIAESPWLNLYSYPAEADYERAIPLGPTWTRLDSTVRHLDLEWELPEHLRSGEGALIYLSLGSLGSADVGLMQRLVDLLATTRHRAIVSKGPLADQITLHDGQVGASFLAQPAILPLVDLVITHGGNNTVTEAFHHGKPMIVLPLFWDQVDNAQRVDETGFGRRLSTYGFEDEELTGAIDDLLTDEALMARLAAMSARIKSTSGTVRAADLIERVGLG